jgi:hypothetical protein
MSIAEMFMLRGAIASVALSHNERCTCDTCKAAHGDEAAFERVMVAYFDEVDRREGRR